jgi:hypothetical protein
MVRSQTFFLAGRPLLALFGNYTVGQRTVTTVELAFVGDHNNPTVLVPMGEGAAICAPGDYCRQEIGEKKALAAAMRGFSRESREQAQDQLEREQGFNNLRRELKRIHGSAEEPGYGAGV